MTFIELNIDGTVANSISGEFWFIYVDLNSLRSPHLWFVK